VKIKVSWENNDIRRVRVRDLGKINRAFETSNRLTSPAQRARVTCQMIQVFIAASFPGLARGKNSGFRIFEGICSEEPLL
jgi:hypothetical protein